MPRERREPARTKRADVGGGDGKGVGEEDGEGGDGGGGDDGSSEDDYDGEDGTTTPGGGGPRASKSLGMADAMSRILGPPSSSSSSSAAKGATTATNNASRSAPSGPVILSKTITPLQRLQQKLKMEERALRQKRRNRRAENLVAMRLPLAPTAGMSAERLWKQKPKSKKKKKTTTTTTTSGERRGDGEDDDDDDPAGDDDDDENAANAMAIANEIEKERAHRRIATRGVVALFNAISKHRSAVAAEAAEREETRRRVREEGRLRGLAAGGGRKVQGGDGGAARTTKHGFLDMFKMSAAGAGGTAGVGGGRERGGGGADDGAPPSPGGGGRNNGGAKSTGWSALKDDFMMNSKLKVRDFSTCTTRLGAVTIERHFFARSHYIVLIACVIAHLLGLGQGNIR
jgi:hypothetical protein